MKKNKLKMKKQRVTWGGFNPVQRPHSKKDPFHSQARATRERQAIQEN